jgi:hypothetical protein
VFYHHAIFRSPTHLFAVLLVLPALAGCGSSGSDSSSRPARSTATAPVPALATRPAKAGEIVVRGEASPESKGPYTFKGRYTVRFEQYAPEDASLDFSDQTPFSAALTKNADDETAAIKLFEAAARTGSRTLKIDGRYFVNVSFGDFPYVVRFTPRGA